MVTLGDLVASLSVDSSTNLYPQFSQVKARNSLSAKVLHPGTGLTMGAYQGTEKLTGIIRIWIEHSGATAWAGGARLMENLHLGLEFDSGQSRYQQFSRLFDANRIDTFQSFSISGEYRLGDGWDPTPKWVSERNDSTIALSRYRRSQYLIEMRKEFQ